MRIVSLILLTACSSGVEAIVDADRPEHYFDVPFPSDELITADGTPDLTGFPEPTGDGLLTEVVRGWKVRDEMASFGFANNGPFYFRFADSVAFETETAGDVDDGVLLIDMETGELLPLEMRFYEDAHDDPFVAPHMLAAAPALGHPPRSGARLAAVVMRSAGVKSPKGYELPEGVNDALDLAGVKGKAAVATTFTVTDATGELQQLFAASDEWLGDAPDWSGMTWKRVTHLDVTQGTTPVNGEDATIFTATFDDASTEDSYLSALDADGVHSHDFSEWPVAVYQASFPVPNYSGLADRPYMSPGIGHLSDTDIFSGWFEFENGTFVGTPDDDATRVVLQIPLDGNGGPRPIQGIVIYDHGTGGHAYNAVQRRNALDRGKDLATVWSDAGWAVLSHDAPLYGTRFPLIDEGYTDGSLGYYNIVNLPAFRDNERQTAIEGHLLRRFAQEGLADQFPSIDFESVAVRKIGHSLGSVTGHLSVAPEPDAYESNLGSGTGGIYAHYILSTGLLNSDDPDSLTNILLPLLGFEADDNPEIGQVIAASVGIEDEPAQLQVDRLHPTMLLFQWGMEPADPMAVARDETTPEVLLMGIGDWQVPNLTTEALGQALPDAEVVPCTPLGDYDPHYCMHREDEGIQIVKDWMTP
ncbi:MAG: hypothetical protein KC912_19655 [Proteobacteria bacterium]|nr:hypothetical protein [Pseudomonadota bacterium]